MATHITYKDMMEQSTQTININEIAKRKKGRPKGTGIFTEEENKERARQRARLYHSLNLKKNEKESVYNIMQKECCLKRYYFLKLYF